MQCAISAEQLRKFRRKIGKDIQATFETEGGQFNLKDYLSDLYSKVLQQTGDKDLALDYIKVAPLFVDQVSSQEGILDKLLDQDFDFRDVKRQIQKFNTENGIQEVINYLGIEQGIADELKGLQSVVIEEPEVEPDMPTDGTNVFGSVKNIDVNGDPVIEMTLSGQFKAYALTFMSDSEWETLSVTPGTPGYNVQDPQKTFYFDIKREVLTALRGNNDGSVVNFRGQGPVQLKAVEVSTLTAKDKRPISTTDKLSPELIDKSIALVLVNQNGETLRFDPTSKEISQDGVPVYFTMRNTDKFMLNGEVTLDENETKRAAVLAKNLGMPLDQAKEYIKNQIAFTNSIREYIKQNPKDNSVILNITGGSEGFPNFDFNAKTKLASVANNFTFHVDKFGEKGLMKGQFYIQVEGISGMPVKIDPPYLKDTEYVDSLITLLTEQVYDDFGNELSLKQKQDFINTYLYTNKDERVTLTDTGLYLRGKRLDLSTAENVAKAQTWLREYFTGITSTRVITKDKAKGKKILKPGEAAAFNTVTLDEQGRYWINEYVRLNAPDKLNTNINDVVGFTTDDQGRKVIITKVKPYNQIVKENFTLPYLLNDNNEIVKVQAYLTFEAPVAEKAKLEGAKQGEEVQTEATLTPRPGMNVEDAYQELKAAAGNKSFDMYNAILNSVREGKLTPEEAREVMDVWKERKAYTGEPNLSEKQMASFESDLKKIDDAPVKKEILTKQEIQEDKQVSEDAKQDLVDDAKIPYTDSGDIDILGLIDDNANDPTLNKNLDQKNADIKATKEQIVAAKAWYENSPLSKIFPFEAMFNLINTSDKNSVATWSMNGIRLWKGSDFSDLYHEAYHGFSQGFLTKDQKKDLYDAVTHLKGTFVDHTGKRVQFSKATDIQAEEYLAEGFRRYMLSGGAKKTKSQKINNWFDILFNILDALFGNLSFNEVFSDQNANDKINNIYEKLRVGNLTEYSFDQANASFGTLNSGMIATDSGQVVRELSYEDSAELLDMIDSLISDFVDLNNTLAPLTQEERQEFMTLQSKLDAGLLQGQELADAKAKVNAYLNNPKKTNKFSSSLINKVNGRTRTYAYVKARLDKQWKALAQKVNAETNPAKKAMLATKADTLKWALNNFGTLENMSENLPDKDGKIKGVMGYHMQKSRRFLEDITEQIYGLESTSEQEILLKGREVNSISNEHSSQDLAKKEILFLLKSLHEVDDSNNPVLNDYGIKKLVDFSEVWNKVAVTLQNNLDVIVMYSKLEELAKSYPPVRQLLSKIGSPNKSNMQDVEQTMWSSFFSAFNLTRAPLVQTTIERTVNARGEVTYISKIGASFGSFRTVGRAWESEFQRNYTNPFIKSDQEGNYLDIDAVIAKYPSTNAIKGREVEFLNDIGMTVTNNDAIKQILQIGDTKLGIRGGLADKFWFSLRDVKRFKEQSKDKPLFVRSINDIIKEYPEFGKSVNEGGNFKTLQEIELQFGDERSNFMVQNAEGNSQFEHMLNNSMSVVVNTMNDVTSVPDYQTLITLPHMAYLDIAVNPNAKYSTMLNSIFIMDEQGSNFGKRRRQSSEENAPFIRLDFNNLSGTAIMDVEGDSDAGVASAKADEFTKLIMDFHMANNPNGFIAEMMRHSDKSTSFAATLTKIVTMGTGKGAQNTYIPIEDFANSTSYQTTTYNVVKNYLFAEHERIKMLNNVEKQMEADPDFAYDKKYLENGQKFNIFHDIFSDELKEKLLSIDNLKKSFDNPQESNIEPNAVKAIISEARAAITEYFQRQADSVEAKFNEAPFISGSLESRMRGVFPKDLKGDAFKASMKSALIKSMVANMWIHNVETINIFYGDLAMYNHVKQEFHKRNAGIGSTGTVFRTDDSMLRYINNRVKRGYSDRLGIKYDNYDGRINTAIIEDINSKSVFYNEIAASQKESFTEQFKSAYPKETAAQIEARVNEKLFGKNGTQEKPGKDGIMHSYANMNEADAQGYLTLDMYRILNISQGEWNFDTQEKAYQEIIKNNGKGIDQTQLAELFPPAKYQYWGALQTTGVPPVMAFHKYSLMPLIPGMYKEGSNADKLHKKMMQEGIDYVTYQSGSKIGTLTKKSGPDKWYNSKDRTVNTDITFTKNTIFANFLKNQLKIHKHFKGTVTFPTQLRKLIEDGLMEFGVPTDFRPSLPIEDRIAEWAGLSETERLNPKNSKFYNLVKVYENNIGDLTELKKKKLLEQAGLTEKDGQITGDQEKLWSFVKNELTRQDLADHEIDFIQVVNGKLARDLSMSLSADKIEKLLNAIVTRRLIKQKFHGEGLFQLSSAMFENPESTTRFTNPTKEDLDKWGSNDLPFYRIRDGKVLAAKVKIALHGDFEYLLYLKDKEGNQIAVKDAEGNLDYDASLDKLNSLIKDDAWLDVDNHREMITMVGVRIPTQGLNSMEFMEVYEFLPKSASNIIILPAEIVAKSGADFDIDKLTVLMPNISKSYKTEISNANLRMLQNQYPELDFSRDNVNMILDAAKNDNEVYTLTPEDTQIIKALEQFVQVEASYKTNKSEKGLENNIITNIKNILELPENYASLTRPNGIDILDPIQSELADQIGGYNPSFTYQADNKVKKGSISPTRALEIEYNLYKHYTNNIGKQTLGLGAVDNTFNTLLNRVNAYLEPIFNGQPQTLYLPHNTLLVSGQKAISLASRVDAKGEYRISDIINQMINGWVDIAKDAWIFNIQGNKEIAPALLFMVQAGVPIEQAIYMASIPSVREYVRQQKLNKSTYSEPLGYGSERSYAKSNASKAVLDKLGFVIPEKMSLNDFVNSQLSSAMSQSQFDGEFKLDNLKEIVKSNKKPSAETTDLEKMAFLHFLQIEEMAKAVRDVKLSMNLDTAESKSLFEASNRKQLIAELKQNGRISPDLVDRLLNESPISSFAIQDFQLAIWKDAFELRNHPVLNKFVSSMLTQDNIKSTLGDNEKVAAALKNDVLSYIFQNSFNTASLTVDGLDSIKAYRGYDVALMENAPVEVRENSEKLRMGAAMFNGVMYIDKNRIIQDFVEKSYVKGAAGYASLLLAPVDPKAFTTIDEYTKFVLEREYLRGTLDFDAVKDSKEFKKLQTVAKEKEWYPMRDRESSADYKSRVTRNLLEMTLRDKALDNSFNNWKLFQSTDTFAHQFARIKDQYPSLTKKLFPLLKYLVINKNDQGYTNIKLTDTKLDADTINRMHQMFLRLTDPASLGIDEAKEAQAVANFFRKFPVVGFLQSGLNTRGQFALGRILPQEILTGLMEKPVKDFVNHLNKFINSKGEVIEIPGIFDDYGRLFLRENSNKKFSSMFRGKNYKTNSFNQLLKDVPNTLIRNSYTKAISELSLDLINTERKNNNLEPIETIEDAQNWMRYEMSFIFDGMGSYAQNLKDSVSEKGINILYQDELANNGGIIEDAQSSVNVVISVIKRTLELSGIQLTPLQKAVIEQNTEVQPSTQLSTNLPGPETKINIYAGTGENAELSNFADRAVTLNDRTFRTPEGAFQAMKIFFTNAVLLGTRGSKENLEIVEKLQTATGAQAKRLGAKIEDLSTATWDRDSSGVMKNILTLSFEQNPDALSKLLATGNATLTHTQDKGKWGTEFPRLLMEVREELRATQPSTSVKPTVDLSREWSGDLESRPVYTSEGVNTMRTKSAKPNEHFGNPWSEGGYAGTIKTSSISEAAQNYKDWLLGNKFQDIKSEQKKWILEQINQGKLDAAKLLYSAKLMGRGQGSHANSLAEVVEQLRSTQPESLTIPQLVASGTSPYRGRFSVDSAFMDKTAYVESDIKLKDAINKVITESKDDALSGILKSSLELLDQKILDRNLFVSRDRYIDDSSGNLGVSAAIEFLGLRRTTEKIGPTPRQIQTMAHELTHMMTLQPFIKESDNVPLTAKEQEFLTEIGALYNYVKELPESKNMDYYNPMLNEFEFIADALADSKFRAYLNSIDYSKGKSILTKLIEAIKKLLGVRAGSALETVVDQVYSLRQDSDFKHYDTLHHLVDEMRMPETKLNLKKQVPTQPTQLAPLTSYVSVEDLQKNPTFEGMAVEFVKEIESDRDKKIGAYTPKGENRVIIAVDTLFEKYNEKAWTDPATQKDDSKATPLEPNAFSNFNEFLTFVMLHEKAHKYLLKNENEKTGPYEDRINNEAMRRLNQIGNKEVQTANVVVQDMVTITDQMVQDFMFNVCK